MERRLAAILAADVVGYSRLMEHDEAGTLARLEGLKAETLDPLIAEHRGRIIKQMGDGFLIEFASIVDAVACALAWQSATETRAGQVPEEQALRFRIGVNLGDVIVKGDDVYGEGVNLAARLEGLAEPGAVLVSQTVADHAKGKLPGRFEDLGEKSLKNMTERVRVFRVAANFETAEIPKAANVAPRSRRTKAITAAALVLVIAAGAAAWWQLARPDFEPVDPLEMVVALPDKPSMAVLALDDLSSGEDRDYLSDAIAEGIITELSRFSEFFVIARNSSFKYRDTATDVRTIAKELGVHYIIEGSQQKSGNRLRVTVQLIDAVAGNHIWADSYDRNLADLFAVQDEIVREIAAAVGATVAFRPPPSGGLAAVSALHLNLQGIPFLRQWNREGTLKALELNLSSVEADPNAPYGYIGLAFIYPRAEYGWLAIDGAQGLRKAEEAAEKALVLAPNNYNAHYARAFVHTHRGEQDRAIERYRQALELNPNAANVKAALANSMMYKGRVSEALDLMKQAVRLDPHHPDWFKWDLAWAQWGNGDCDSALATMQAMNSMPNRARRMLAVIQVCLGQRAEAEATIAKFLENEPSYSVTTELESAGKLYFDKSLLDRYVDGLRQAGLPE